MNIKKISPSQSASRTADAFQISLNSVSRYLRELEADNVIRKEGNQWHLAAECALRRCLNLAKTFEENPDDRYGKLGYNEKKIVISAGGRERQGMQ